MLEIPEILKGRKAGDRVLITLPAVVTEDTVLSTAPGPAYGYGARRSRYVDRLGLRLDVAGVSASLAPAALEAVVDVKLDAPKWQPGDVVVVRWSEEPWAIAYTYVRGSQDWPGDRAPAKTDAEISELFRDGRAKHVLRDGAPVTD